MNPGSCQTETAKIHYVTITSVVRRKSDDERGMMANAGKR